MAGKKLFWPVNFITSPAIGRCVKKLVLGPGWRCYKESVEVSSRVWVLNDLPFAGERWK